MKTLLESLLEAAKFQTFDDWKDEPVLTKLAIDLLQLENTRKNLDDEDDDKYSANAQKYLLDQWGIGRKEALGIDNKSENDEPNYTAVLDEVLDNQKQSIIGNAAQELGWSFEDTYKWYDDYVQDWYVPVNARENKWKSMYDRQVYTPEY